LSRSDIGTKGFCHEHRRQLRQSDNQSSYNQNQQSTTNTDFTKQAINSPQITSALTGAQQMYQNGDPTTQAGLTGINTAAGDASSLYGTGNQAMTSMLNGSYANANNPYFQNMFQGVANSVTPAVAGSFEGNGRYGSGAFANALSSNLSQEAGNLAYQNYGQGLGLMSTAAGQLPAYTAGSLAPGAAQLNAGYMPLQQYIQALGAISPGQTGTSTSTSTGTSAGDQSGSSSGWNVSAKYGT
jgi:hypothetical protein